MAVCFHFCSLTVQIGLQKKKLKDSMEFVVMMCLTNKGIQYQLQDLIIPVKSLRPGILELKPNPQNPPPSTFLFVDSLNFSNRVIQNRYNAYTEPNVRLILFMKGQANSQDRSSCKTEGALSRNGNLYLTVPHHRQGYTFQQRTEHPLLFRDSFTGANKPLSARDKAALPIVVCLNLLFCPNLPHPLKGF